MVQSKGKIQKPANNKKRFVNSKNSISRKTFNEGLNAVVDSSGVITGLKHCCSLIFFVFAVY